MIVQVHFMRFYEKKCFAGTMMEPSDSHILALLIGICISTTDQFALIGWHCCGGPSRGYKNHYCNHPKHYLEPTSIQLYIQ